MMDTGKGSKEVQAENASDVPEGVEPSTASISARTKQVPQPALAGGGTPWYSLSRFGLDCTLGRASHVVCSSANSHCPQASPTALRAAAPVDENEPDAPNSGEYGSVMPEQSR